MKLIKEIKKILANIHPECNINGHRVHTTMTITGESWSDWSSIAYGIAGGFVHFEDESDGKAWHDYQNGIKVDEKPKKMDTMVVLDDGLGRCVNECGPIGFHDSKAA